MKANSYIPALTGVRAIAAFLVFFHHINQVDFPFPLKRTLNEFHMGVTMFFLLSGFLICMRYYDSCELSENWFRKYIKNRIARIYPMYLLLTVVTFGLFIFIGGEATVVNGFGPVLVLLLNIFFLRGFFDDFKFTGVAQGWSLTVEESFYFLAPLLFMRIKKNIKAIFYLPVLLLSLGLILVLIFRNIPFYGFFGNFTFMFLYTFLGRCTEFFIGMGLALIVLKMNETNRKYPLFTFLGLFWIAGSIGIMASLPLNGIEYGLYHPLGIITNNLVLPVGIAFFYFGLIKERSVIRSFLSSATMQLLGKSSYIFYLIHIGVIANFTKIWSRERVDALYEWLDKRGYEWLADHLNDSVLFIGMVFILLNLVSILLFKTIEEPLNLYIRKSRLLEKKQARPA
ncbi:MAG: acyltransferase [Chitinophagaceae bacterium]|nr:acyltransferase [Chitinophagaceae bacterium]